MDCPNPAWMLAACLVVLPVSADEPEPPAQEPPPKIEFAPQDILETKVVDLGDRDMIIQRVVPPVLPEPPPPPSPDDPAVVAWREARLQLYAGSEIISLSATVYDHSVTLLRWSPQGLQGEELSAWVNVDLHHFGGRNLVTRNGRKFRLNLGIGDVDTAREAAVSLRRGEVYQAPAIPEFPAATPALVLSGGTAPAGATDPVEAILDVYRADGAQMSLDYQALMQANAEQKAWQLQHPPEPQDIVIRRWRTGGKAVNTSTLESP